MKNPGNWSPEDVDAMVEADQRTKDVRASIAYQTPFHMRPPETWTLTLNRYQRDNLLWLLNAVGYPWDCGLKPFTLANTGDWVGEVVQMLGKVHDYDSHTGRFVVDDNDRPNVTLAELQDRIARWLHAEPNDSRITERTDES